MQIPSSNHSTGTSRRSNTSRQQGSALGKWLEGFIDKACCVSSLAAGDEVDDNSIAFSENDNENRQASTILPSCTRISHREDSSVIWEARDESIQWFVDNSSKNKKGNSYRQDSLAARTPTKRMAHMPQSPGSDATATTVLTGSSHSSRGFSPSGAGPSVPSSSSKSSRRSRAHSPHSTGNIRNPEDEWRQQQEEERRIHQQLRAERQRDNKKFAPREVSVPVNWSHEHGLRRIQSDTYKLPFQTVEPDQVYYRPNN